jgi:flagellar M-ring protein FliF
MTDQYGRLYHSGSLSKEQQTASRELNLIRERQNEIKARIESLLTPIVGIDAYSVQVNLDMDFTRKEKTMQTFNPELSTIRSERTIEDTRNASGVQGVPGALSNQPPGESQIPETIEKAKNEKKKRLHNQRLEAERNYEVDTTISHILNQVGIINRISVSIGLDYILAPKSDPNTTPSTPKAKKKSITS